MSRPRHVVVLTCTVIMLACLPAFAQGPQPPAQKTWLRTENASHSTTSGASMGATLAKSLLILAVIGAGGYLLWRRSRHAKEAQPLKHAHVRVLSGTQIGPKARAVVADVGGRLILLGVTEHSVRRLAWLESDSEDSKESEKSTSSVRSEGGATTAHAHTRTSTQDKGEAALRGKTASTFSEVLRDAVGIKSKRAQEPALLLADATRDHVAVRGMPQQTLAEPQYLDVEGQAAGLVARLNRRT